MCINLSRHVSDPNVGLSLSEELDCYKMFVCDTGLFITLAFWDKSYTENVIYEKLLSDKLSANLGYVYENLVAQMLIAAGVYGESDLMAPVRYLSVYLNVLKRIRSRA